jgi:hypothetical protein
MPASRVRTIVAAAEVDTVVTTPTSAKLLDVVAPRDFHSVSYLSDTTSFLSCVFYVFSFFVRGQRLWASWIDICVTTGEEKEWRLDGLVALTFSILCIIILRKRRFLRGFFVRALGLEGRGFEGGKLIGDKSASGL